jgi:hypothetical protein
VVLLFSQVSIARSTSSIGGTSGVGNTGSSTSVGVGVGVLQAVTRKTMTMNAKIIRGFFTD